MLSETGLRKQKAVLSHANSGVYAAFGAAPRNIWKNFQKKYLYVAEGLVLQFSVCFGIGAFKKLQS
jgi:hypothetical protein